ncbi:MAG: hypothetical protein LBQ33_03565, partial [Oscillospiraceae bacterium]|nr:hypothetical protein [Oscillospiraceae bacterium]
MNAMQGAHAFAAVAVERAAFHFDQPYCYRIPEGLRDSLHLGCRVMVPFGNGARDLRIGVVLSFLAEAPPGQRIKSIQRQLDDTPLLPEDLIQLVSWLKQRTFCTLFEAFRAMVPAGLQQRMQVTYCALPVEQCPPEALLCEDEIRFLEALRRANRRSAFVR